MPFQEQDIQNLQRKVNLYNEVLNNTKKYRDVWKTALKAQLLTHLNELVSKTGINATIIERNDVENLQAIVVDLGTEESGLDEPIGAKIKRPLIKQNGALIYQQLFNGKIMVLINLPFIEKLGQPQPPKTIAIYRPEELKEPYILRHLETLIADITHWEDYDDDVNDPNQKIGFKLNFEGEANK